MNNSNEQKYYFGHATLRIAAYIVLLNAVLSGCAGSLGSNRGGIVGEATIYDEISVVGPIAEPRRVRIRKRPQKAADRSWGGVSDNTASHLAASDFRFIPWPPSQSSQIERFPLAFIQALDLADDDSNSGVQR